MFKERKYAHGIMVQMLIHFVPFPLLEKEMALETKLAMIREQQNQEVEKTGKMSEEDRQRKEAILAQYAHVQDGYE